MCACIHGMDASWDPTALRRPSKPQQLAAARVRAVLWGHSGVNQE
jgi:hypothetical protein